MTDVAGLQSKCRDYVLLAAYCYITSEGVERRGRCLCNRSGEKFSIHLLCNRIELNVYAEDKPCKVSFLRYMTLFEEP
jgi:hypothetical protein